MIKSALLLSLITAALVGCSNEPRSDSGEPYAEWVAGTCRQISRGIMGPPEKVITRNAEGLTDAGISREKFEDDVTAHCPSVVQDARAGKTESSAQRERRRNHVEPDECKRSGDRFSFAGRLRNDSPGTESYRIDVEVVDSDNTVLARDSVVAASVSPGETMAWTASGPLMGIPRGTINCRIKDVVLRDL